MFKFEIKQTTRIYLIYHVYLDKICRWKWLYLNNCNAASSNIHIHIDTMCCMHHPYPYLPVVFLYIYLHYACFPDSYARISYEYRGNSSAYRFSFDTLNISRIRVTLSICKWITRALTHSTCL